MLWGNLGKKNPPLRISWDFPKKRGGVFFGSVFIAECFVGISSISDLRSRLILFRVSKFARIWCRKCMFIYTKARINVLKPFLLTHASRQTKVSSIQNIEIRHLILVIPLWKQPFDHVIILSHSRFEILIG